MSRDPVERLAFSAARQLRAALEHPATANEHASGYGTVCLTGHPVFERLWLQCVDGQLERGLVEAVRDIENMAPIKGEALFYAPQLTVPRLPMVLHVGKAATIDVMTPMWVLDELRWLAQRDAGDAPRSLLDMVLSRLNHGNMTVVVHFIDLVHIIKRVIGTAPEAKPVLEPRPTRIPRKKPR
jgi:hypothetical protein